MDINEIYFKFFDYLWRYFDFHASQRITLFKFYTGFCTLIISAIGYLFTRFHKDSPTELALLTLALAAFLILITFIFRRLDDRNRQLIHYAEESLRHLEANIQSTITPLPSIEIRQIAIFTKEHEDKINGRSLTGHTFLFRCLFNVSYIIGFTLLVLSICKLKLLESLMQHLI